MQLTGFIGPSNQHRSPNVNVERTLNLYPEIDPIGSSKNHEVAALVSTPGLQKFLDVGSWSAVEEGRPPIFLPQSGFNRGLYAASNGIAFVVVGKGFYQIMPDLTTFLRGTVEDDGLPVAMADNGTQLVVVSNKKGWVYNFASKSFDQITDPNFPKATAIAFYDQYFLCNDADSGRFQFAFGDALNWDGLDMSTAEGSPDKLITLLVDHRELFLFGEFSTEIWFNCGDPNQPFARTSGGFIEQGIAAAASAQKMDNSVFWVSKDRNGHCMVVRASQSSPQRISTHAVELALSKSTDIAQATAWTYQDKGHSFYVLNAPGLSSTWVYDVSTNLWHERSYTKADGTQSRHRAEHHCFVNGKHLVGDYENNKLYELRDDQLTDEGAAITRERVSPHFSAPDLKAATWNSLQLDMETGVGPDGTFALGSDPQVMLQYSDDGGHAWSSEKWVSAGKIGEYRRRAIWRRLGRSRDRVFRIRITDAVKVTLISAFADVIAGSN